MFKNIFEKVTERFESPIKLSRNCEANTFYRVEDLTDDDVSDCGEFLATRVLDTGNPDILLEMPGSALNLANVLAEYLRQEYLLPKVISLDEFNSLSSPSSVVKGKNVIIINDVITTGRSCLEAHSKLSLNGANVLCWVALVDRTFGPGPVPVVATLTGDPVRLLD